MNKKKLKLKIFIPILIISLFLIVSISALLLDFVPPTPVNNNRTGEPSMIFNFTVEQGTNPIDNINWSWNGINYSFYDKDLVAMYGFDTEFGSNINQTNLEGYWDFGEGSGTVVSDKTTNGRDLTVETTGSNPEWVSGKFGATMHFEGTNQSVVSNANSIPLGTGDGTWGAWIYPTAHNKNNYILTNDRLIVGGYSIYTNATGHVICFLSDTDISYGGISRSDTPLSLNEWHFVACGWDASNQNVSIYVDGSLYSDILAVPIGDVDGTVELIQIGAETLFNGAKGGFYNGSIDEAFIFTELLSPQQIIDMNNSKAPTDWSSYGNDAENWGGLGINTSDGKYGTGGYFNGIGDYVSLGTITDSPEMQVGSEGFTIMAWVQPTGKTTGAFNIATITTTLGGFAGFDLRCVGLIEGCDFRVANGTDNVQGSYVYPDVYLNNWFQLTGVFNKTSIGTYLDGELIGSAPFNGVYNPSTKNLRIGNLAANYTWFGNMDDYKLYNRSFEADEVKQHYYSSLQQLNSTRWAFETNQTLVAQNNYTYQGCASDNVGNSNCTELRNIEAITSVTDCLDIEESGTYVLENDIIDSSTSSCIDINVANVVFDCNGNTIDGDGFTSRGIDIYGASVKNIIIRNCKVNDWTGGGIYMRYSPNVTIEHTEVSNGSSNGITSLQVSLGNLTLDNVTVHGNGDYGFQALLSNEVIVKNSHFYDNTGRYSIYLNGANHHVYNNIINSSSRAYLSGSTTYFNITPIEQTNIVGGAWASGNFWASPSGNGFSESGGGGDCIDIIEPIGICDNTYQPSTGATGCTTDNDCDHGALTSYDDIIKPYVNIYSPINKSFVNGEVTISATATDDSDVANVTFTYINSTDTDVLCVDTTSPYDCVWNTDEASEGGLGYDINATAWDTSSNSNSSFRHYTIDRTIAIVKDLIVTYPFITHQQTSVRDTQQVLLQISVIDSPEVAAGLNISIVDLTDINGTGNFTMLQQNGSKSSDEWSTWNITANVSGSTGQQTAQIYVYDLSTPNNVNDGNQFIVEIDNDNPTYDNLTYGHIPTTPYFNEEVTFYINEIRDNYDLDYFIYSNNKSGTWQNASPVTISDSACGSDVCAAISNDTMVGQNNFSYYFILVDDAGNQNSTEIRDIGLFGYRPELTVYHSTPTNGLSMYNPVNISFTYNNSMADNCSLWIDADSEANYTWQYPLNSSEVEHQYGFQQNYSVGEHDWFVECVENVTHTIYPSSPIPWTFTVLAVDTCTCAGVDTNWEINMEDNCVLDTSCDLGTGTLSFINSGWFNCDARLEYSNLVRDDSGVFYENNSCTRVEG